jgi:hypothetical protein
VPTEPDRDGSEPELLQQYLDVQRQALLAKTEGLDREQLAQSHPPSMLTLGGLLCHLSLAEEDWMEIHFLGEPDRDPFADADWDADPDWHFRAPGDLQPEQLRQRYPRGPSPQQGRGPRSDEPRAVFSEAGAR